MVTKRIDEKRDGVEAPKWLAGGFRLDREFWSDDTTNLGWIIIQCSINYFFCFQISNE